MPRSQPSAARAYGLAVAGTAAAVGVRWLLDPWIRDQVTFTTLYGAIAATVWYGGYRPALVSVALGLVACVYLFIEPRHSFAVAHSGDYVAIVLYLVTSAILVVSGEAVRAARHRIEQGRELLLVTFGSIGDALITTDPEGRVTYLNPVAESLTGWTLAEANGQPLTSVFRIVNEQTRNAVENPAMRALREGVVVGLANHTVLIRKDGSERPIDDSASPIRDPRGGLLGCVLIFRDITARRQAEKDAARLTHELQRSGLIVRSIVDHVLDAVITIDATGTIESFNPAAERIFGFDQSEVLGRNVRMLMPDPYQREHDDYLQSYLRTGVPKIIGIGREVTGLRRDGSTFPMDLAVSTFQVGERRYFTGIVRDITERKRAEEASREADQRKDEFLATLSHELRNPLAPIRNAVQTLKLKGATDPDSRWSQEVIDRQVQHMSRLLDDLLDVSRISYNKLELRKEIVELAAVVQSAVEATRPLVDAGRHELALELPRKPVYLDADPVRLAQVFSNLLGNAAKYTEPPGHIRLTAERRGDEVVVSVKDDGIGIAPDMLPHIFDMFSQVQGVMERSQGGLGLGLALVRGLVELHGGSVAAESDGPGRGSRFDVRLPCVVEKGTRATAPSAAGTRAPAITRRILIVDDVEDQADSLALWLRSMGHEVHTAYNGSDAIHAAEKLEPEVILLDLGLPDVNGYDACRQIRRQPSGEAAFVIAVTGWGQQDDRLRTKEAGFDHHLVKPVDAGALMKLLADLPATRGGTRR